MNRKLKILFVEDVEEDYELLLLALKRANYDFTSVRVQTKEDLIICMMESDWDIVISDNQLPKFSGIKALETVRRFYPNLPFILVSGSIGEEAAVNAMRSGASDYILKDNLSRLVPSIEREILEANKHLKQQLKNKKIELKYQLLTESIRDVFFALDYNLNFTFWNEAADRAFNKSDVLNKHIFDVFPEWQDNHIPQLIEFSIKERQTSSISLTYEAVETDYFEGTIFPTSEGVSVLLNKVTERKKNRDNLIKLNNELETVLYRISHDLKGPIASVIGLLNIVALDANFNKENFLHMMRTSMFRLDSTLKELLNISNIKLGKPNIQHFNVKQTIEELLDSTKFTTATQSINFKIEIDTTVDLFSDLSLFKCVWQNLIDNSIKYTDRNKVNNITIIANKAKKGVLMTICDTGQGIPENLHPRLYEMFFRGNEGSSGSGLGLYIVKNALQKINGAIEIDNNYKDGARFEIFVPNFDHKEVLELVE